MRRDTSESALSWKDVTGLLPDRAGVLPVITLPSTKYNEAFSGDLAPGIPKRLKIQYRIDGKPVEVALRDNDPLQLPVPP